MAGQAMNICPKLGSLQTKFPLDIECVRGCKNKLKNWLARDPIQPNI
jgi:hypothetical protein